MENTLQRLYAVLESRREDPVEGSYTSYLLEQGLDKILKKIGEEATESVIAALGGDDALLVGELADLTYHILVLLVCKRIPLEALSDEMEKRSQKIGNKKPGKAVDRNT